MISFMVNIPTFIEIYMLGDVLAKHTCVLEKSRGNLMYGRLRCTTVQYWETVRERLPSKASPTVLRCFHMTLVSGP